MGEGSGFSDTMSDGKDSDKWEIIEGYLVIPSLKKEIQNKYFEELLGENVQISGSVSELKFGEVDGEPYRGFIMNKGTLRFIEEMPHCRSNPNRQIEERENLHKAVRERLDITVRGQLEHWYRPKREVYHIITHNLE